MKTKVGDQRQFQTEPSQGPNAKSTIDFRMFAVPRQNRSAVYWYKRMKIALAGGEDPKLWISAWDAIKNELLSKREEYSTLYPYGKFKTAAKELSTLSESSLDLIALMLYELSRSNESVDIGTLPCGQDFFDSFIVEKNDNRGVSSLSNKVK